jgi:hypothetical protein
MFKAHFNMDLGSWKSVVAEIVDKLGQLIRYTN